MWIKQFYFTFNEFSSKNNLPKQSVALLYQQTKFFFRHREISKKFCGTCLGTNENKRNLVVFFAVIRFGI
jgi:hypothetical protein